MCIRDRFGTAHAAETPVHDTSQAALAQSQLRDVTGRVTDRATGDPIVGVTVANNSTGSGTVTDAAGAFTVKAATGQLLTISCVGYTLSLIHILCLAASLVSRRDS